MAGGRGAAKVALKGIAKPLEALLKECDDVLKVALKKGAKPGTKFGQAGESLAQRAARRNARRQATSATASRTTNWGKKAKRLYGDPPASMSRPHGHHVVYQNGSAAARQYSSKSQELLRHYGIDPIHGNENLIWAPNRNHTAANAKEVLQRLTDASRNGATRSDIVEVLQNAGRQIFDGWP